MPKYSSNGYALLRVTNADMAAESGDDGADDGDAADDKDNDEGWAAPASCKYLQRST